MRLHVFVAALGLGLLGSGGLMMAPTQAQAQSWGQPRYAVGRDIGETRIRAYAATGDHATGYGRAPRPYVPAPWTAGYRPYGYAHDRGGRYGYSVPRSPPRYGYRDDWGYQDDRPPSRFRSARSWRSATAGDCYCDPPYLYDR